VRVHQELGPGLLESVYEAVLARALIANFDEGFRADIVVDRKVILELKCVDSLVRVHHKQLLTYLKLTGLKLGFLLNFGSALMKDGIVRKINGYLP
jgi:hypothetical protein